MDTVTNKGKVLSVEGKVKLTIEKNTGVFWEFGLVNSMIQKIWENRTKIIRAFEKNGSRIKLFRKPKEVRSIRGCFSGLNKRDVTTNRRAFLSSFFIFP